MKLGALVRDSFGITGGAPLPFPGGVALLDSRQDARRGWILVHGEGGTSLGSVLAWAQRHHLEDLHLIVEGSAGALARRAAPFGGSVSVWWVRGSDLHPSDPEPLAELPALAEAPELEALLASAGLERVAEHAHVAGELLGLEVARIVETAERPEPHLEVGVGQADRELTTMLHGDLSPEVALARVVDIVGEHRRPSAPAHPLNQLVPERWLRAVLARRPDAVGLESLEPLRPLLPRGGLRERGVAFASGRAGGGGRVIVACSVGVDLDLVPSAAEVREAIDPSATLMLVLPRRDLHPVTSGLASSLREPARIEPVEDSWRELGVS